jgi:hypothetical protein
MKKLQPKLDSLVILNSRHNRSLCESWYEVDTFSFRENILWCNRSMECRKTVYNLVQLYSISTKIIFCAIVLYLVVYHVCFQDGKLCLLVANDKLDGK